MNTSKKEKMRTLKKDIAYMNDLLKNSNMTHKQETQVLNNRLDALKKLNQLLNSK